MDTGTRIDLIGLHDTRIPATILTGFLGSGKTTLVNHILSANFGLRIAIIVNELGEIGIDGDLIEQTAPDDIVELTAGCICCTIRGDLLAGLERLLLRNDPPEYLIIETTGIADPLPVAQTFFLPGLRQFVRLDGIITLVDVEHFFFSMQASKMVAQQLSYANIVILNKIDLVAADEVFNVEEAIRELNPYAPQLRSTHGQVDLRLLLDVGAFRVDSTFGANADHWLMEEKEHEKQHHTEEHTHDHLAEEDIGTVSYISQVAFVPEKLEAFLNALPVNIVRGKGVLNMEGYSDRCIFHHVGGRMLVESQRPWRLNEQRESRLVFIGKTLDANLIRRQLGACTIVVESH